MRIRIKEAREVYEMTTGKKLTVRELAEATMYDYSGSIKTKVDILYRMQSGRKPHLRLELVQRIADYCGVDYNFIITD